LILEKKKVLIVKEDQIDGGVFPKEGEERQETKKHQNNIKSTPKQHFL
jgi:hypothetical protein